MTARLASLPEFRRLWFVGLVSFVVRWLEMLAIGIYAYQITSSAFVVALMSVLRLLPMSLFGALMGAAADRYERRSVLILTIVVSTATALALGALAHFDVLAAWHLAAASFIGGVCWATDYPVRRMMIGDVVGNERMSRAMSFDVGTSNASRVVGPIISGVLLAQFGIAAVFWFGAALHGASLVAALRIRMRHAPTRMPADSFFAGIREGFEWVRRDRRLTGVFVFTVIFNIFGWPAMSMVPVIGSDYLHLDPKGVGLLASTEGIGGLVGAVLVGSLVRPQWYARIFGGAVATYLIVVAAFATAPLPWMAGVALFLCGASTVAFSVLQATLVYRDSPVEMRSRLLGVLSVFIGTSPIGFLYLGVLADHTTSRIAIVALAAQGILVLILARRYWLPVMRVREVRE